MDAIKSQRPSGGWRLFSRAPRSQGQALVGKEILMFVRDPAQWTQLLLILALLSLYLFNLSLLPEDINNEQYLSFISVLNFGFCGFILSNPRHTVRVSVHQFGGRFLLGVGISPA